MRGPAADGDAEASVPSLFAAIVRVVTPPTSSIFPPRDSRGSDCPGQKSLQIPARSYRPLCSLRFPSATSVLRSKTWANQSVLPMSALSTLAACVTVAPSVDPADL
jgi:hypothetical protein